MKTKIWKIIAVIVAGLVLAVAGLLIYVKTFLPNVGDAPEIKITATPEMIKRGEYLANQ